jgi:hypothetical protein
MRLPKTITAILVILLVLLPCIYCVYFQVKEHLIWQEMEEKLEGSQLQTVTVPVQEFRWYQENREIIVAGMMFDVKSIRRENAFYVITGLFDEQETALHIAMGKLQARPESGPDTQLISELISQTLILHGSLVNPRLLQDANSGSRATVPGEKLYSTILSILTPPPRAC